MLQLLPGYIPITTVYVLTAGGPTSDFRKGYVVSIDSAIDPAMLA